MESSIPYLLCLQVWVGHSMVEKHLLVLQELERIWTMWKCRVSNSYVLQMKLFIKMWQTQRELCFPLLLWETEDYLNAKRSIIRRKFPRDSFECLKALLETLKLLIAKVRHWNMQLCTWKNTQELKNIWWCWSVDYFSHHHEISGFLQPMTIYFHLLQFSSKNNTLKSLKWYRTFS